DWAGVGEYDSSYPVPPGSGMPSEITLSPSGIGRPFMLPPMGPPIGPPKLPPAWPQVLQPPPALQPAPQSSLQALKSRIGLQCVGTSRCPPQYRSWLFGDVVKKPGPPHGTSHGSIASTNSGVTRINSSTSFFSSCTRRNGKPITGTFEMY